MEITLQNPLDMHLHLREGEMLDKVIEFSAKPFSSALAMPNLKNPLINTDLVKNYEREILDSARRFSANFSPIMSLYFTESLDKTELKKAKNSGIKILKLYPKGATTGAESGVSEILNKKTLEIFEGAQELGFILSIHGETNGFCLDREFEFGEIYSRIARDFPRLKIIMEHLSDKRSIEILEKYDNLFATLTLHHITMSLDDVLGGSLNPHHFCKPMLKTKSDQRALLNLALNAHKKVSFGSDSAPHLEANKLKGAAGIFSAPSILERLCELFFENDKLENLEKFVCKNALNIYDLKEIPQKTIKLRREDSKIIEKIETQNGAIIPLNAGKIVSWKINGES